MRRGDRSNSLRLDFTLRLDEFGTGWRARKPFASSRWRCCESWWADEWQRGRRSPAGRRASRPPGPVAPLQLRPPDPGERAAVLVAYVSEFAPTWARDTRRRLFVNLEQLKLSVMFDGDGARG